MPRAPLSMPRLPDIRLACVDLPGLPLQLLLRRKPEWKGLPAAVVAEDRPQAELLWVNEEARGKRVLPGQRYAAALSLARELRAAPVAPDEIAQGVSLVTSRLRRFSPHVEPAPEEPGVFFLDASGLSGLYPSLSRWAEELAKDLLAQDLRACVAVGFSRFGGFAAAKVSPGVTVFSSPEEERKAAAQVPLSRLSLDPVALELLGKLGVVTVGGFLALPADGVLRRFGPDLLRLHRAARNDLFSPLQPAPEEETFAERALLDFPESDATRLLFLVKRLLDPILEKLAARQQALVELVLHLSLDRADALSERLRPAAPTLDGRILLDLVRLRLSALSIASGVVEIAVTATALPATPEQLALLRENPKRDLEAGERALARLRSELGEDAVVSAALREAHLPEASFSWQPASRLSLPHPRRISPRVLVRRLHTRAIPLPLPPRHEPEGWLIREKRGGPIARKLGPYLLSGAWWASEVAREYHYFETIRGDLLWVYFDRVRRRWFLQGIVE